MTLTEFLLERIAEDEAVARAASEGTHWTWDGEDLLSEHTYPIGKAFTGRECIIATEGANPPQPETTGAHIARHDPARVLAECEAKRRIVDWLGHTTEHEFGWDGMDWFVLQHLALPYADHPDYDERWRP